MATLIWQALPQLPHATPILSELEVPQLLHQWAFLILLFRFRDVGQVMLTVDTCVYPIPQFAT